MTVKDTQGGGEGNRWREERRKQGIGPGDEEGESLEPEKEKKERIRQ